MNKKIRQAGIILCLCLLTARGYASNQDSPVVVIFNNTKVYASDIQMGDELRARKEKELDADAFARFEFELRMTYLANQVHQYILERVLAENEYKLTDAEYEAYVNSFKTLGNKNPYAVIDENKKIEIQATIRTWHFDSFIYKKYGGKVVATPNGLKPVEAYKTMIDEFMATNTLIIPDIMHRGVLTILYTYFENKNKDYVSERKADIYFKRPFWGDFVPKKIEKKITDEPTKAKKEKK